MSESVLLGFGPDTEIDELARYGNSSSTAPLVWAAMTRDWQFCNNPLSYDDESLRSLFRDAQSPRTRMAFPDRVMVLATGWKFWVSADQASWFAAAADKWLEAHDTRFWSNAWPEMASTLRDLDQTRYVGFGIWHTTVSENPYGEWVEAGYDRWFQWRPARFVRGPWENLRRIDLRVVAALAGHRATR